MMQDLVEQFHFEHQFPPFLGSDVLP